MRTSLFSKDKFRQFWNYKNKKLTIAFIINWTIIALIAVIFIIIGSIDMYITNKKLELINEYNERYRQWVASGKPSADWSTEDVYAVALLLKFTKMNTIINPASNYIIALSLVVPLYVIVSNLSLLLTKYYLSKKHNKNN